MPSVDISDETFVVASRAAVREAVCDERRWARWFPDLALTAYEDRGRDGVRWILSGALAGTAEVWLEEFGDGTVVHVFVRAEPTARKGSPRRAWAWARRHYVVPLKRRLLAVKDELEPGREPGTPRVPPAERVVSPPRHATTPPSTEPPEQTTVTTKGAAAHGRPDDVKHPDRG